MVGKNPAFLFYPNDWQRDLGVHPRVIKADWVDILCHLWWQEPKGMATHSLAEWSKVLRIRPEICQKSLRYLLKEGIASGEYLVNQNITIISRRMVRDEEIRKKRSEVGAIGGKTTQEKIRKSLLKQTVEQTVNQNTKPSVAVSVPKEEKTIAPTDRKRSNRIRPPSTPKEYFIWFDEQADWFLEQHMETLKRAYPGVDLKVESDKMKGWIRGNYSKRKSDIGRFMTRWYRREQDGGLYSSTPKSIPRQPLGIWGDTKPESKP